jgi:hypothetical protein
MAILVLDEITYFVSDRKMIAEPGYSIFGHVFTEVQFRDWVSRVWGKEVDISVDASLEELARICRSGGWAAFRSL